MVTALIARAIAMIFWLLNAYELDNDRINRLHTVNTLGFSKTSKHLWFLLPS